MAAQDLDHGFFLRRGVPSDAPALAAVVEQTAELLAVDPSGSATFWAAMTPAALEADLRDPRFVHHLAFLGPQLAGYIALRERRHLFNLFVVPAFHRRGIARRLWHTALAEAMAEGPASPITVNSSLGAIEVYRRFGFVANGPQQVKNGVSFLPMIRP